MGSRLRFGKRVGGQKKKKVCWFFTAVRKAAFTRRTAACYRRTTSAENRLKSAAARPLPRKLQAMARCVKTPTKGSSQRQLSPLKAAQDRISMTPEPRRRLGGAGCFRRCAPPRTEGLRRPRRTPPGLPPRRPSWPTRRGSWTPSPPTTNSWTRRRPSERPVGLDEFAAARRGDVVDEDRACDARWGLDTEDDPPAARVPPRARYNSQRPADRRGHRRPFPAPPPTPPSPWPQTAPRAVLELIHRHSQHPSRSRTRPVAGRCPGALRVRRSAPGHFPYHLHHQRPPLSAVTF